MCFNPGVTRNHRMLLSRRILIGNLLLLAGLLALGMAPLWGLFRVQDQVQVAVDEYTELRLLQRAALHLALARTHMACDNTHSAEVTTELNAAADVLREYVGYQDEVMEGSAT